MADLSSFDPNSVGVKSNTIFGLPFTEEDAQLVLLPVPWEVTISYRDGTSRGPEHVYEASLQIDLYDSDMPDAWKKGIYMPMPDKDLRMKSDYERQCAQLIIRHLEDGGKIEDNEQLHQKLKEVNQTCGEMVNWVYERTSSLLKKGKKVGLLGGDHSTPLGFIKALAEQHGDFGVLQVDAHADLRNAYEGFTYSHASIMYNVLKEVPQVSKLVQVGIRDYCDEEVVMIRQNPERIATWFDKDIKERQYEGSNWKTICDNIVADLPKKVYISFDIDGLDPKLCPNTGTPVPGGFELEQVNYLFKRLVASGREIIGFDVNEVSEGEHNSADSIDSIVGARALYKLCNFMLGK